MRGPARPMRIFAKVGALLAALALAGAGAANAPADTTTSTPTTGITVTGVDLHDGTIAKVGSTYYMYGTMYGCGFNWAVANTPWCGFGVSKSTDMRTWSAPKQLFSPSSIDPFTGTTWKTECGSTGAGCFNPRMIQRTGWGKNDGVNILWFNSPADWTRNHANAYNVMGCNSPEGPCGPTAGKPYGSYHKPSLKVCTGNGDFGIYRDALYCTMPGSAGINSEQLDANGANGTGVGTVSVAALTKVEGPGVFRDPVSGKYVLTYSDPNCGYCAGTGAGYAVGTTPTGQFTAPKNVGWSAPATGRRDFSATSCGGQPRTVFTVDGQPWLWIDQWIGTRNETNANVRLEPLTYRATWPNIAPLQC